MKKKLNAITTGLIVLIVSAALCLSLIHIWTGGRLCGNLVRGG